jgi:hypothetical protein
VLIGAGNDYGNVKMIGLLKCKKEDFLCTCIYIYKQGGERERALEREGES